MTKEELLKRIAVLEDAAKFNYDNLMILERNRQKAWDENKILKVQANCPYTHMQGDTCTKCGWFYGN